MTINYDEKLFDKYLFEQRAITENKKIHKKLISITNAFYRNDAMVEILYNVTKYLLYGDLYDNEDDKVKYQNPHYVRYLLWKWLVVVIYRNLNTSSQNKHPKLEQFMNGINVYDLINLEINDNSIYSLLLNKMVDKKNDKNKDIKKRLSNEFGVNKAQHVYNMYRLNMSYFQYNANMKFFIDKSNEIKIENIVCEAMNDNVFTSFEFEIINEEKFEKNLIDINKKTVLNNCYVFMSIFIDDIINKYKNMKPKIYELNRNRINLHTLNKDFKVSDHINFIDDDIIRERKIIWSNVVEFTFRLNDEKYLFSKDGIKKIDRD